MCEPIGPSRRDFMALTVAATGMVLFSFTDHQIPTARASPVFAIRPRREWSGAVDVSGLPIEQPGDVRVLVVHHTAGTNTYGPNEVPGILRGILSFHTGSQKGWPDVAYNFFVDRYGQVWEGRSGSASMPVIGDATGGYQGYSMMCCFLGDHTSEPPTAAATEAMVSLLSHLARTYDIDTTPGATASFVSRGSNLHPVGQQVVTPTITGHRTMSATICPGDAAQRIVSDELPQLVTARLVADAVRPPPAATEDSSTTTTLAQPRSDQFGSVAASGTSSSAQPPEKADVPRDTIAAVAAVSGLAGVAAIVTGALVRRRFTTREEQPPHTVDPTPPDSANRRDEHT